MMCFIMYINIEHVQICLGNNDKEVYGRYVGYLQIYMMPFYIREFSICGFWYPQRVLEPVPMDSEGQLY